MGRPLPPAPGRRRLHDADQGPRRGADRRPGPRDRRRGRRLRRGARRQPGLRQPLRRPHHPPGHPAPLDPHRRRAPDLAALLGRRADHGAGVRRLGPQRVLLPGVGHRRRRGRRRLPVAQAISAFFTGNREYANLPAQVQDRRHRLPEDCARVEINDIGLWPAEQADGTVGFNVLVGGGLSDGERMASDIDVFVRPDQAVELCRAVAQVFGELGNRENRGLARMRYLAQELGPEGFRAALDERTTSRSSRPGGSSPTAFRGDHVGVHPQKQPGLLYVGCSVPVGRMHGIELVELARLAETYGDGAVRIGTDQNFIVSGVPEERLDDLLAEPLLQKYSPFPGPFERGVVACTGSEFCRFAVVETKERAVKWARAPRRAAVVGDAGDGAPARRRGHPHALLGLLGLVRPAPDRRHRLPWRHRPRRRAHRRGRRHRPRRLARARRRVHRLGRAAPCRSTRSPTPSCGSSRVPGRAPARRALPPLGPPQHARRAAVDAGRVRPRRWRREALPPPRADERDRRAARARSGSGSSRPGSSTPTAASSAAPASPSARRTPSASTRTPTCPSW